MDDIVERLRKRAQNRSRYGIPTAMIGVLQEAADLIDRQREEIERLRGALTDATAHLAGAASAYRKHASRHASKGNAVTDPFFGTRADDFDKAVIRARSALSTPTREPDHG